MARKRLGRYELKTEIGRGGMAIIYLAHDPRFKRDVALKVLPQQFTHDPAFLRRFEREAQTLAKLEHMAIVPVYDFGETDGIPYLVMRHMSGGSLLRRLASGPLPLGQITDITERIASALDSAHDQGVIHRDVKPSNILFDSQELAYLSDFGIVKLIEQTTSFTGTAIVGTPAYMSPEQVHGDKELDARSDIYSLGIVLYEMFTGQQPFKGETPSKQMMAHVLDPVPRILEAKADLPPQLDPIISRALAKDPADRYQSATQLARALLSATEGEPVPALTTPSQAESTLDAPAPGKAPSRSLAETVLSRGSGRWALGLVAIGIIVVLLVFLGSGLFGDSAGTPTAALSVNPTEEVPSANVTESGPERTATGSPTSVTPTGTATLTRTPTPTPRSTNTTSAPTPRPRVRVSLSSISVRSGPGQNYPSIDFLFRGDEVDVMARTSRDIWYQVVLPEGSTGWVSAQVVDLVDGVDPASIATVVATPTLPPRPPTDTPSPPPPTNTPVPPPPAADTATPVPPATSTQPPPADTATPVPPPTNTSPPPTTNP